MLEIRPSCENCNVSLPNNSENAMICTFECTFCKDCVDTILNNVCPNCGGGFTKRPTRPKHLLEKYPVSIVLNENWARGMGTSIAVGIQEVQALEEQPERFEGKTVWLIEEFGIQLYFGDTMTQWMIESDCQEVGDWSNYVAGNRWVMKLHKCSP